MSTTTQQKGCPWYCNIPTGIVGLTVSVPGADCSGCNNTTDVAPINKTAQAVANPASAVDQGAVNAVLGPLLSALPGIGIKVGIFMLALMLVIIGFWVLTEGNAS